jgi:flagellar motor switch protein FliN/FliY
MSQFDEVFSSSEWAFAFAEGLERQLGDDRILTVGSERDRVAELIDAGPVRRIALPFVAGSEAGVVTFLAGVAFSEALERGASDEILLTACAPAFDAAVRAIGERAGIALDHDAPAELDSETTADDDTGQVVVYPLLDGGDLLACVTLRVVAAEPSAEAMAPTANGATADNDPERGSTPSEPAGTNPLGASYVLADVEMGVTAELGRCRMTMRELLSITPGAVIDLDRAAGAPVDVLVNGTLIARGEVVVIDEEFGIRISELVPQPAAAR